MTVPRYPYYLTMRNTLMHTNVRRRTNRISRVFMCLCLAMLVGLFTGCSKPRKGPCYWKSIPGGFARVWPVRLCSAPGESFSDRFVSVVVTDDATIMSVSLEAFLNDSPVPTDSAVSAPHQTILTDELISRGLYDPGTQNLNFFRSSNPMTPPDQECNSVRLEFSLNDGEQIAVGTFSGLGALEISLNGGAPLKFSVVADDLTLDPPLVDACADISCDVGVPTVSEWGLIVIAVLTLTVGTIVFGRRRRSAAA